MTEIEGDIPEAEVADLEGEHALRIYRFILMDLNFLQGHIFHWVEFGTSLGACATQDKNSRLHRHLSLHPIPTSATSSLHPFVQSISS